MMVPPLTPHPSLPPLSLPPPSHTQSTEEKAWLAQHYEESRRLPLSEDTQKTLLGHLIRSQSLDLFLAKKFQTLKRYGAEGAEAMMGFFQEAFSAASAGEGGRAGGGGGGGGGGGREQGTERWSEVV